VQVTTDSGLTLMLERSRPTVPNVNGNVGTVQPAAYGGPVMGPWGTNVPNGAPPVTPWQGWPTEWDTPTWNGQGITQRVGIAATCADLNSRQMASFPTYVMRGKDMIASPSWTQNPEPSLYNGWDTPMKQLVNSLQLRGETFLYATGRYRSPNGVTPGQVARWAVMNPDRVKVTVEDGSILYWLNGEFIAVKHPGEPIAHCDVLHIPYQSWPGQLHGIGPLEWCAANVVGAAALESMVANIASRGGVPWAVLKTKRQLDGTQSADLQSAWVNASSRRNGAPAVLSGDLELDVMQISPRDLALLDLRIFDETRICVAFGVPGYLVGLPQAEGLVYANASSLFDYHWRATLRPLSQTIAGALSAWALPNGQALEFNPDRYVAAPIKERAETYQILFNIFDPATGERGITIEQIHELERFNTSDPGVDPAMELTGSVK
jgi:HK97 family phage portal protein